ncbi:MAG: pantetheine-phosphate adenylyltransferase [Acetobacteraceae bacterium]|nr:pantetheine-phosphate adenylyltransferase [Acetobacteraceae bacterium]
MKIAVYPGSFDPVTLGHVDLIERASRLFDRVVVAVFRNPEKQPLFSVEERVALLRTVTSHLPNVEVDWFEGLQVEYAGRRGAGVIIRGMRAFTDFEYELQMAQMNKKLNPSVETVFVTTSSQYAYVSSRVVKEIASFGGCVRGLVPPPVETALQKKYQDRGR